MKKLAVLVVIAAVAMFIPGAMATADDHEGKTSHHGIEGIYAVTGFTSCNPLMTPSVFEAYFTFSHDGNGAAQGVNRGINGSVGGFTTFTSDFTYEVTRDGSITFDYHGVGNKVVKPDPVTNAVIWEVTWDRGPSHGVISPDGKTITITCGPPVVLKVIASEGQGAPPIDYTTYCVTTGVGMRVK